MNTRSIISLLSILIAAIFFAGCRPVEPKVLATAESNETMFVIPLQGDNTNQAQLNSVSYLNQKKVAVKEIQMPHRWLQTGRDWQTWEGRWIPTVKVIKVNRSPVTVTYEVDDKTKAKQDADAIWLESSDSVGFSTGFIISAMITEEDTSTFLYRYPSSSLLQVLNTEVRAMIQERAAGFSAKFKLDDLRSKKNDMLTDIRTNVIAFYKERGITITTIGQSGGMAYENDKIQVAIDDVFIKQQEKEKANALLAAQKDINLRSESAAQQERANAITVATGLAEATRLQAEAVAKGNYLKAKADADGIKAISEATKEAASNPLFLEVRKLDVQTLMYNRWNGSVPNMVMGGTGTGVNVFLPHTPESAAATTK